MIISKRFTFEASHILPKHQGKCSRLHGHSWGLVVAVRGPVNPDTGFVIDYSFLSECVNNWVIKQLDHAHLGCGTMMTRNGLMGFVPPYGETFYPTSENLSKAIGRILQPLIQEMSPGLDLDHIMIEETCTSACTWRPEDDPR